MAMVCLLQVNFVLAISEQEFDNSVVDEHGAWTCHPGIQVRQVGMWDEGKKQDILKGSLGLFECDEPGHTCLPCARRFTAG